MLFILFIVCIGLLSYYFIFSQINISSFQAKNIAFSPAVSVIICAKNESANLDTHLSYWLNQKYENYEVIIVNDQSTDTSNLILEKYKIQYTHLRIIDIPVTFKKKWLGKRNALWQGILAAKNEYLLFTDADCKPLSIFWIKEMMQAFENDAIEIVLGYSPYQKEKGFLNGLIRYETLITALQYMSFAHFKIPYMSVGRNVAYKKSVLNEKVFEKSNQTISGDDDLVFQKIANKNNVAYVLNQNSWTESKAPSSFKEWTNQKKRHLRAGIYYPITMQILLGLFSFLNIIYFFSVTYLLFTFSTYFFLFILIKPILFTLFIYKTPLNNSNIANFIKEYAFSDMVYWLFYITFAALIFI